MTTNLLAGDGPSRGSPGPPRSRSEGGHSQGFSPPRSAEATETTSFELRGLVLLDSAGNHPVVVHALRFGDDGIGLVGREGSPPRVLPWASVSTHAVEPWTGGIIPRWWVDTARHRGSVKVDPPPSDGHESEGPVSAVELRRESVAADNGQQDRTARAGGGGGGGEMGGVDGQLPHVDAGALIDIQTPSGTFRFLLPRSDPATVADRIMAIAIRHRGVAGASSVTTAIAAGRRGRRWGRAPTGWERVQRLLVVILVAVIATAVTLILLQSAGAVHLPFLGGTGGASATSHVRMPWRGVAPAVRKS